MKLLGPLLLLFLVLFGCAGRRVVAEPEHVRGLSDPNWIITSEPEAASEEDPR